MRRLVLVPLVIAALFGCDEETPCDRYADYMCTCHADDPGFDCEAYLQLAESPTGAVIDQCAIDLADQQEIDEDAGESCAV